MSGPGITPIDPTWRGFLSRDLSGRLEQEAFTAGDPPSVIVLTARRGDDGALQIQGMEGNQHWVGYISVDRTSWVLGCQFGYTLRGTVAFAGGRYELVQTELEIPRALLLGDEAAVRRCGVGAG
jgi:hypothetical protein